MTFTVWKRVGGPCYIMPYQYKGIFAPTTDYIPAPNYGAIMILVEEDSTLIVYDDDSVKGKIECHFRDNKKWKYIPSPEKDENDEAYSKGRREHLYRLPYIEINILESYARTYLDDMMQLSSDKLESETEDEPDRWDRTSQDK